MSTRDLVEKDYYAALGVPKDASRPTSRRPTASWPASCTRTRTRTTPKAEAAVQGGLRGLRRALRRQARKEYDEARSLFANGGGPRPGGLRWAAHRGAGGVPFDLDDLLEPARRGGPAPAASATCSAVCSAVAPAAAGPRRGDDLDGRADHLASTTRCAGSRRRSGCPARRPVPPARASAPSPAPCPRTCPTCQGLGRRQPQPGRVRALRAVPRLPRHGLDHRRPVPGLPRHRPPASACSASGSRPASPTASRLRVRGRGGPASAAVRPATWRSSCTCTPHPVFGARTGRDLTHHRAGHLRRGGARRDVRVPTLDGGPVTRQGARRHVRAGERLRVRGRGAPTLRRRPRRPARHRRGGGAAQALAGGPARRSRSYADRRCHDDPRGASAHPLLGG